MSVGSDTSFRKLGSEDTRYDSTELGSDFFFKCRELKEKYDGKGPEERKIKDIDEMGDNL